MQFKGELNLHEPARIGIVGHIWRAVVITIRVRTERRRGDLRPVFQRRQL